MVHVSGHAIERYQERIANLPDDEVRAALSSPAIEAAARFGASFVRLASGHRVALIDGVVTTILPAEHFRRQVLRYGIGRFGQGHIARKREG